MGKKIDYNELQKTLGHKDREYIAVIIAKAVERVFEKSKLTEDKKVSTAIRLPECKQCYLLEVMIKVDKHGESYKEIFVSASITAIHEIKEEELPYYQKLFRFDKHNLC